MKLNWLDRGLIDGPFMVLCLSEKELKAAYKHCKVPYDSSLAFPRDGCGYTAQLEAEDGGIVTIVALGDTEGMDEIDVLGLLIHEASHVVDAFFEYIKETKPSDEFRAYCLQATCVKLIEDFRRKR